MTYVGPVGERQRIASLDVLRGLAIFGIFMVNMQFFAMPLGELFAPAITPGTPLRDALPWAFTKAFFEYKFISLFSLLFGAGLAVQLARCRERGEPFVPLYARRLAVLAIIGLFHGFFLWYGDILFLYACVGALLMPLRGLRPKVLLIIAGSILGGLAALQLLLAAAIFAWTTWTGSPLAGPAEEAEAPAQAEVWSESHPEAAERYPWLAVMLDTQLNIAGDEWRAAETAAYRDGPWSDALGFRAMSWVLLVALSPFGYGWHVIAMFLVGAALMKLEFFSPSRIAAQRRMCVLGLSIGLPIEIGNAALAWAGSLRHSFALVGLGTGLHELGSVALCLGLVGGVCLLVEAGAFALATRALASVGRLALSNYLLSTVVTTFLMYWWGLGWFGGVPRLEQIGLVAAIYAGQVILSIAWLKVFTIGPVEWLWRTLTYLKVQPVLRR